MSDNRVTLVTSSLYPNLGADEETLPAMLRKAGLDVRIAVWNDPTVDWSEAGVCIVRSVRDYAENRQAFLEWAHQVPRLLNPADVMEWATDKHYLNELEARGLRVIPTTWLEPEANLSKHQLHCRFPAYGDFVAKPAISSGGREMGRYNANLGNSRMKAITHVYQQLQSGNSMMVQRYLDSIDNNGEISLIYFNGVLSHCVEKKALLTKENEADIDTEMIGDDGMVQEDVIIATRPPTASEWEFGEEVRRATHSYIRDRLGHDQQFLFLRVDMVRDETGGYYLMEVSPVDANLYLSSVEGGVKAFADAITTRVLW